MMATRTITAVALALAAIGSTATARDLEIASVWTATPPPVDGTPGDWAPLMRPLGDPPLVVGVRNDAESLYLCVRTSDPMIKRELRRFGLTVWLDGEGKNHKSSGLRFPAGPAKRGSWQPGEGQPQRWDRTRPGSGRPAPAIELIGPTARDRARVEAVPGKPVQAAIGDDAGVMVLEYRVPLAPVAGTALAVGAGPGATIALGLATELPSRKDGGSVRFGGGHWGGEPGGRFERRGYGDDGGGPGGYGNGPGGDDSGRGEGTPGGMRGQPLPVPIGVWLRVRLATPPAATQR